MVTVVPESFTALITRFLAHLRYEARYAPTTVRGYGSDLRACEAWLARRSANGPPLAALTLDLLEAWLVAEGARIAAATQQRRLAALRACFRFAKRRRLVAEDPTLDLVAPKLPRRLPEALSTAEIARVLETPYLPPYPERSRALLEVLYATGIRAAECLGLELADVDREGFSLRVVGKGDMQAVVPIWPRTLDALDAYLPIRGRLRGRDLPGEAAPVFVSETGARLATSTLRAVVRERAVQLGLIGRLRPHVLRHSIATHLHDNGADLRDIQALLRHADIRTTQRYTHVTADGLARRLARAHPFAPQAT